jgi:hypothetical protein
MLKVVHITWEDPCFAMSGWMTQSEFTDWLHAPPAPSDSVGILAYETADYVVLLQSIGDNQVADGIKITRSAIRSIKEIGSVPLSLEVPDLVCSR